MIDRRNISYTQGTPNTPIHKGEIVIRQAPSITNVAKGEVVSRARARKDKIADAGVPEILGEIPIIGGMKTAWNFWTLLLGSPEEKIKALKPYLPIGDVSKDIFEEKEEEMEESGEWYKQPVITVPFTEPIPWTPPNINLDIFGGLKDVGKWLLVGGLALGGLYIAGKMLGKKK